MVGCLRHALRNHFIRIASGPFFSFSSSVALFSFFDKCLRYMRFFFICSHPNALGKLIQITWMERKCTIETVLLVLFLSKLWSYHIHTFYFEYFYYIIMEDRVCWKLEKWAHFRMPQEWNWLKLAMHRGKWTTIHVTHLEFSEWHWMLVYFFDGCATEMHKFSTKYH